MDSLDDAASVEGERPLEGQSAMVLGAGGAAKAIAFGLLRRGAEVTIASRTFERSQELAERLNCRAVRWEDRHGIDPHILINATPVGMHPNVDESPFDKRRISNTMIVFDTVYNPELTLLVKDARAAGAKVITGVEMFVRQAAYQFKLFTGQDAPVQLMRDTLKKTTGAAKY
jgi:3-dehydroquinate dehydratase/shikimate dehydrogenase